MYRNRQGTRAIVAVVVGAALALTACSPDSYKDHNFRSLAELADAVGWDCMRTDDEEATQQSLSEHGWTQSVCSPKGNVSIYESAAKRDKVTQTNGLDAGWCRITGGNWAVLGPQFQAEEANKVLKGDMVCA